MINYMDIQEPAQVVTSIMCDVCGKEYHSGKDDMELQEFHFVDFIGGYASVFGDDVHFLCDICQHCLKKLIDKYIRVDETGGCDATT